MRRILLLTALVITSLCALAQQLRNPFKMTDSKNAQREYLQRGIQRMANPLSQQLKLRYGMQPTNRLLRTNLPNDRHITAKALNTEYNLVTEQPARLKSKCITVRVRITIRWTV